MNSVEAKKSYISLFSSGGIGDLGFKEESFFCVASAELLSRRIEVQRINGIAEESRLICGDLLLPGPFEQIVALADSYVKQERQPITAIIATPPCQGMSVANHKKGDELVRNSLVVRSIELIKHVKPLVFIFENVPAFMKTTCTGLDGGTRKIGEEIEQELGSQYEYFSQVLQLSEFGSPSSRKRSLTIGVRNDVTWVTPLDLYPDSKTAPTLRELIGDLPPLARMGECSAQDLLHSFRPYEERMRSWIKDLKDGQSAFENKDPMKRPHRVINGKLVPNVQKNGDKYRRVPWDAVAPCVHTRNDILASQNTIHPVDDRVFSIRELMRMMGVPDDFEWFKGQSEAMKELDLAKLKSHDVNIRQCLGEAVPVPITKSIAKNIKTHLVNHLRFTASRPKRAVSSTWSSLSQIAAYIHVTVVQKKNYAAYYTEPLIAFALAKRAITGIGNRSRTTIRVLEPSAGSGVFLEVLNQFARFLSVELTCIELDADVAKRLDERATQEHNFSELSIINTDFLNDKVSANFDLIVGNPPFGRQKRDIETSWGSDTEVSMRFLRKALSLADVVAFVLPKALLHASYYKTVRQQLVEDTNLDHILDFGEFTFPEVKVETIGMVASQLGTQNDGGINKTSVKSWPLRISRTSDSDYLFDKDFPTWVIYRDAAFDREIADLELGRFLAWRDRRISRKLATKTGVRVIRGKNLSTDGSLVADSGDYFVPDLEAESVRKAVSSLSGSAKFLAPNLSYKPRVVQLETIGDSIPEGSCAILYGDISNDVFEDFLSYASSPQFHKLYRIACNYSTRSINIDNCLAFWWGVPTGSKMKKGERDYTT